MGNLYGIRSDLFHILLPLQYGQVEKRGSLDRVHHFRDRKIRGWCGRLCEFSKSLGGGVGM